MQKNRGCPLDTSTMKKIVALFFLLSLASCATLTETQINAVHQFANAGSEFSKYPEKVANELAVIRRESRMFDANAQLDRAEHIKRLEKINSEETLDLKYSRKIELTFAVLDKYAQSLLLLSTTTSGDLEKQAKNFGIEIDSLIGLYNTIDNVRKMPIGIGGAVSRVIAVGGKNYLRARQAKDLKKFIPEGDVLVAHLATNLVNYLDKKVYVRSLNDSLGLKDLIAGQRKSLEEDYGSYLSTVLFRNQIPPLEYDREYLSLLRRLDGIEKLRKQTIAATQKLQEAHAAISKEMLARRTLKQSIKEVQALYEDVKNIRTTLIEIKNP